jgi:sulfite reductase alpha subunit-like flavoprotein
LRAQILILYASQTGTSQEVAGDVARALRRLHFSCRVLSFSEYRIQQIRNESLVIFVVSTCGQGEFPDSAKTTWAFLRRADLPSTSLNGVEFCTFGLGDSSYSRFNVASKLLEARILQLGASKILPRGDGDDQHRLGLYGGFMPWLESLTSYLNSKFPLPPGVTLNSESSELPSPRYKLLFGDRSANTLAPSSHIAPANPSQYDEHHPYYSHVIENTRITAEDWTQDVRHVALSLPSLLGASTDLNDASTAKAVLNSHQEAETALNWQPGDVVYIMPQNFPEDVTKVLKCWELTGEEWLVGVERLDPEAPEIRVKEPMTVRDFLAASLDISGVPRRYFFELLAHFASESVQAEKLRFLASAEGQEDLHDYARRAKRSFLDVLDDFDSARPSLDYLLDLFPKLQPRAFSISSSQHYNPSQLTISMVVVRYRSQTNRLRRGVCSSWISQLLPPTPLVSESQTSFSMSTTLKVQNQAISTSNNTPIPIWIKRGTMTLPQDPNTPIIMVGPGTGCAIFKAFVEERIHIIKREQQAGMSKQLAPAYFYFGCRHEAKDFLYQTLWLQALEIGALTQLTVAFSQDKRAIKYVRQPISSDPTVPSPTMSSIEYRLPVNISKAYVQHCLKEDGSTLWDLIHSHKASIFICGNANKMPTDVRNAFITVAMQSGQLEDTEAERYVRNLEAQRRYSVESWS